mgnify:CR=1 FL=1
MPGSYTTISGDTWDGIAYAQMGNERYMHLLILANPEQAYAQRFAEGVLLVVPDVPTPDTSPNLPPWRRA